MNVKRILVLLFCILIFSGSLAFYYRAAHIYDIEQPIVAAPTDCGDGAVFAIIGDYGTAKQPEADVADLVTGWNPEFIVTVGDNNYPDGAASTIDANIGQYYHAYIHPYLGSYGEGASENRFFPAVGNHDLLTAGGQPHLDYFSLPGNERYYAFQRGSVHFFILNSDPSEIDGRSATSTQAEWLKTQLEAADAPWKIVVLHHTPFTSSMKRNPDKELQWPFAEWGVTAVVSGHDHLYERLAVDGIPYFVNGAGGKGLYRVGKAEPESVVRYNQDHGAMRVQANESCLNFSFFNRRDQLIDSYTVRNNT